MKRRLLALWVGLLLLWGGTAVAWTADEYFQTAEALPPGVRAVLPEGMRYLHGMGGEESLFLMMEAEDGTQRVLVFRKPVETWRLDCESPPLDKDVTIGCSGDSLHLFYNVEKRIDTYARLVDGRWMLSYVQSKGGDFMYHPYLGLSVDWGPYVPDVNLITLDKLDAVIPPASPEAAMAMRTHDEDIAMVTSQVPTDRLHLRTGPAKDAASLGRYYSGTPVKVLETQGDWCHVSVAGVTGYMMREYLSFGDDMLEVPRYFLQRSIREEYLQEGTEQIRIYSRPDAQSAEVGTLKKNWQGRTIIAMVGEAWYHVVLDDGTAGYVQQKYFWEGNG